MTKKSVLFLLEQLFMVLAFTVAAVVSIKAFSLSHQMNMRSMEYENAIRVCESMVEIIQNRNSEILDENIITDTATKPAITGCVLNYDSDWHVTDTLDTYQLRVENQISETNPGLGTATVSIYNITRPEKPIIELYATWQKEIIAHES